VRRLARYSHRDGVSYGVLSGENLHQLEGNVFADPVATGVSHALNEVSLLVPLDSRSVSKVIGVANNYQDPDEPRRFSPHPQWFTKRPSALATHDEPIEMPPDALNLNYEGELAVIIGTAGRRIALDDAESHIWGVTIGNDWSENTWYIETGADRDPSKLISKGVDGWASLYTTVYQGLDYGDLAIDIRVNGDTVAFGRTSEMVNSVAYLIHYISHFVTLTPGDVIYSGTVAPPVQPGQRRNMYHGDVVEVEIEGLGVLRNTIKAARR
jgi:2-keto-4-pentenoate hydratase/2-oxohepta-3-ene-1,7-dioic acid hydratase in catechol pathway